MIAGAESERQREREWKRQKKERDAREQRERERDRESALEWKRNFFFGICQAGHLAGLGETSQKAGQVAPGQKL